ncbi:hypothetical protein LCGC14_2208590, partial [marine sediment metagenome]
MATKCTAINDFARCAITLGATSAMITALEEEASYDAVKVVATTLRILRPSGDPVMDRIGPAIERVLEGFAAVDSHHSGYPLGVALCDLMRLCGVPVGPPQPWD